MSRVHDALRRAEQLNPGREQMPAPGGPLPRNASGGGAEAPAMQGLIEQIQEVAWDPNPDAHIIDHTKVSVAPAEEFRSLRTRLNHIQGLQQLHSLVVTSASPAEGKSFSAANLAVVQSHLHGNMTLLCDFDFRRPIIHSMFQIDRSPGLTEYLQGRASLAEVIKRVAGTNLFLLPAGEAVVNPLELLNLPEVKLLLERLPSLFRWIVIDSPPLLFAADANLLSTLCDGTLLVVRLGTTTIDSVTRAIQSMSHNNVLGVVANGAKRGELYSKYTYYHSYYYSDDDKKPLDVEEAPESEETAAAEKS